MAKLHELYGVSIPWLVTDEGDIFGGKDNKNISKELEEARKEIKELNDDVTRVKKVIEKLTL